MTEKAYNKTIRNREMKKRNKTKILSILWLLLVAINLQAQDIEQIRQKAYEAKEAGNITTAIQGYSKVLSLQPEDYDARLALARLYVTAEDYEQAIKLFHKILQNDPEDVEALKGLGDSYLNKGSLKKAQTYYQKAIDFLPEHIPLYFDLAKAYSWDDQLDKAIGVYRQILQKDDTYSEAWQGIGKMYYWMDKPYTALTYYEKAIKLDPDEKPIRKEYENVKNETRYNISYQPKYVNEQEENYRIDAFIQQFGVQKRLNDFLDLSVNYLLDHSDRNFSNTNVGDTVRWYQSAWVKAGYIKAHHKVYAYAGYSSDQRFSSYGLNWKWNFDYKAFKISNNINAGYDYFYYWNNVGQHKAEENVQIKYQKISLNAGVSFGWIDKAFILDVPNDRYEEDNNTYNGYDASLGYEILSKPKINISANYSYLNYTFKSNKYYSPQGRNLFGGSLSAYYDFNHFYVYGNFAYNTGDEYYYENINENIETNYLNADNWSANGEIGYNYKKFSVSVNAGKFFNDYYQNLIAGLKLNYRL